MPSSLTSPSPVLTISQDQARRFLISHQHLYPPRQIETIPEIVAFFNKIGCIQFDPINIVGRNPDLVLQARLKNYQPWVLDDLLYKKRLLKDGFDKVASIYLMDDWPYFSRFRARMVKHYVRPENPAQVIAPEIIETIRQRGPLSSINLEHREKVPSPWGIQARVSRAALELLDNTGQIGIHHRVGTRRVFDLIENLVPEEVLHRTDPNQSDEEYENWHILRRIGSLGLANSSASEYWMGIHGVSNGGLRLPILKRLVEKGGLIPLAIEGLTKNVFYIRTMDLPELKAVSSNSLEAHQAVFLGPLDNLLWDRNLLRQVFQFNYIWEVYKKPEQRQYGYYVLPVLYGDQFIARIDMAFEKNKLNLVIRNWWWEKSVHTDEPMIQALRDCLFSFQQYLGAKTIQVLCETADWMV